MAGQSAGTALTGTVLSGQSFESQCDLQMDVGSVLESLNSWYTMYTALDVSF